MKKTRFSVIMPLYNKAPYVRKALDSIISQTYKDWECIIVDDGSTDGSAVICEEFFHSLTPSLAHSINVNRSFIHSFIRQTNSGVAAARNRGVAESHGEFVCFLDADDWWEPTFLEEMDQLIMEYPDSGLFAMNYVYYKPGKTHVALKLERGDMNYPEAYLHGEMPVWTGATCMPRKVFDEMGGFPAGIKLGEDFLLWAKTALQYKVAFCEKPLAHYNNDVPASLRATRNLHAPEHNMLFHLYPIEEALHHTPDTRHQRETWKSLLDKLRVNGLMDYWLSDEYHDAAAAELEKVDWSKQPRNAKCQYEKPIWTIKAKRRFMQVGSYFKQKIIKLLVKK
jgi:glycosyltransferase involved in cell wall biosynthesis